MTHLPFIQQSVGDVLSETAHLSTEEFGAYQLLVMAFWQHGALPDDDTRLARIVRATPERWAEMRDTMSEIFGIDWTPERLAQRRDEVEATHLRNKANGKKGAEKRWQKDSEANGPANGGANGGANSNHNHNHNTRRHEEKALPYTRARARVDGDERNLTENVGKWFLEKKDAGSWLAALGGFPGDAAFDRCVEKLVAGTATWGDVHVASS